jgi:hypothetical protein
MNKALDRDGLIASVRSQDAIRLSRLRPRGIAILLPWDEDDHQNEIIDAYCGMLQNATSVEVTAPDEGFDEDDYDKICAAMRNITELVLRSVNLPGVTSFSYFPLLRRLQILVMDDDMDDVFDDIIQHCPKLEFLHLITDTSEITKLEDLITKLHPMTNLKELIVDDPPRDTHALQLLTGQREPSQGKIVESLEALKLACPPSLQVCHIYLSSLQRAVNYIAAESLPILVLPFVPERFLQTFVTDFLNPNARSGHLSISPLMAATLGTRECELNPTRTSLACIDILLASGLDVFMRERAEQAGSIFFCLVESHCSTELAHVLDYIVANHPGRLVELLYDSCGLSVVHYFNIFPSGTFEGAEALFKSLERIGDLGSFLNDSNNSERISAVARFTRESCNLLPRVKRSKSGFRAIIKLLRKLCEAGADVTTVDSSGHSVLTFLLTSQSASIDLILGLFSSEPAIQKALSAAPASWADTFLELYAAPAKPGAPLTIWKIATERASETGRRIAFTKAMQSEAQSDDFVWEMVTHVIGCGYDPATEIDKKMPWIALSKAAYPPRVLLFAPKLGWDLGWNDSRGISLLTYATNHPSSGFDEDYAKTVSSIFLSMRKKPQDELTHYARALGLSAFVGNFAYSMLSGSEELVRMFTSVTQLLAASLVHDFVTLGGAVSSSPRVCWLTVEELLYVGVANSIGQEKASNLLQELAAHLDEENSLGNSSVLISAATHACLATKPEDLEWYRTAFSILFSDAWKVYRFVSRSSHKHSIDLQFLEVIQILLGDRWMEERTPIVKLVIDAMDSAVADLGPQEGISLLLFSKLFGLCNAEVALHFSSTNMFKKYPILVVRLLCNLVRRPKDFHIANSILDQHPNAFHSSELAGDWILRNFCYSLDVIHTTETKRGTERCIAMLQRFVELGAKSSTPFSEDYKRQFQEKAIEDIVSLFEKTKV